MWLNIYNPKTPKLEDIHENGSRQSNREEALLLRYQISHTERLKIVDMETYLVSGIWSFRAVPIAPTNNITSTTKLRPTHFVDTAIATPLVLSLSVSRRICGAEKETDTNTEGKSRGRRRRTGERVRGRSPTKRSLYRVRKTTKNKLK
jgi:hypothetical protein